MTQIPGGWYPDPSGDSALRYWDGTAWTAHMAPASTPSVPAGPTTPDGEPLAGWWWRVLAYLIDAVIMSIAANIVTFPALIRIQQGMFDVVERFTRRVEQNPEEPPDFGMFFDEYFRLIQDEWFWLTVPSAVVLILYMTIFLRWKSATPGKLALGLRVRLRERPGKLPWATIAARLFIGLIPTVLFTASSAFASVALFTAISALSLLWLLDPLWATWDEKRQALHDKLARTNVVKTR